MDYSKGCFIGRIWDNSKNGPCLIRIKDGLNPVYTNVPSAFPFPVYEPILEYPAFDARQYATKVPPLEFISL